MADNANARPPARRGKLATKACDQCRRGKRKCAWAAGDAKCSRCARLHLECTAALPRKRRGRPPKRRRGDVNGGAPAHAEVQLLALCTSAPPSAAAAGRSAIVPRMERGEAKDASAAKTDPGRTMLELAEFVDSGGVVSRTSPPGREHRLTPVGALSVSGESSPGTAVAVAVPMDEAEVAEDDDAAEACCGRKRARRLVNDGRMMAVGRGWACGAGIGTDVRRAEYAGQMMDGFRELVVIMSEHTMGVVGGVVQHTAHDFSSSLPFAGVSPVLEILARVTVAAGAVVAGDGPVAEFLINAAVERIPSIVTVASDEAALAHVLLGMFFIDAEPERSRKHYLLAHVIIRHLAIANPSAYAPPALDTSSKPPSLTKLFGSITLALRARVMYQQSQLSLATHLATPIVRQLTTVAAMIMPIFCTFLSFRMADSPIACAASLIVAGYLGDSEVSLVNWFPSRTAAGFHTLMSLMSAFPVPPPPATSEAAWVADVAPTLNAAVAIAHAAIAAVDDAMSHGECASFHLLRFAHLNLSSLALVILGDADKGMDGMAAAMRTLLASPGTRFFFHVLALNIRAAAIQLWTAIVFRSDPLYHAVLPLTRIFRSRTVQALATIADYSVGGIDAGSASDLATDLDVAQLLEQFASGFLIPDLPLA